MRRLRRLALAAASLLAQVSCGGPTATPAPEQLFADQRSGVWIEVSGVVTRLLADDNDGSRHQRFILRLPAGQTLLIVHNIDLAPRVTGLKVGSRVNLRGEYEWNARGGLVHWTHHDPDGQVPGGWVEFAGQRYR